MAQKRHLNSTFPLHRKHTLLPASGIKILGSSTPHLYSRLKQFAFRMRHAPTDAEATLWKQINNNQLGAKFRRQHIIDRFIVDFYAVSARLVIEVDGSIHDKQVERDQERTFILESLGLVVLRFTNKQVERDIQFVISEIIYFLNSRKLF